MNKVLLFICLFISVFCGNIPGDGICQTRPDPVPLPNPYPNILLNAFQQADEAISQIMKEQNSPGCSIQIVYDQSPIFSKGYGTVNLSEPNATPTADTIFRIGSITKVFTSLMLMQLRDSGFISLDDEIRKYQPDFRIQNPFSNSKRSVTFRQLATHLSGLPREVPCIFYQCNKTSEEMWPLIANLSLIFPPNTMPIYSNLGYATLGRILEEIAELSWEDYIQQFIVDPLELTNTGSLFTEEIIQKMAVGYDADGQIAPMYDKSLGWENPAGTMYSSANDNISQNDTSQILDQQTIREMFLPVYTNSDRTTGFALPWELEYYSNYLTRTKRGDVNGFASGIAVLVNTEEEASPIAVAVAEIIIPAFEQVLFSLQQEENNLPPNFEDYIGIYGNQQIGFEVEVVFNSSISRLQILAFYDYFVPLDWVGENLFQMIPPFGLDSDCISEEVDAIYQQVQFYQEESNITGLSFNGLIYGLILPKTA